MEKSPVPIQEIQKIIVKDFQIEEFSAPDLENIKLKLASIIAFLLDKDMNKLLNIFYRIDLNEKQVALILTKSPVNEISSSLAHLVLEREIEKVKTKLKYKNC